MSTRTYTVLDVPATVYEEVKRRMIEAGQKATRTNARGEEVLDMHGIALRPLPPRPIGLKSHYAAGYEIDGGSLGMFAGPSPSLEHVLEHSPGEDLPAVIVEFLPNGDTRPVRRWDAISMEWKKV